MARKTFWPALACTLLPLAVLAGAPAQAETPAPAEPAVLSTGAWTVAGRPTLTFKTVHGFELAIVESGASLRRVFLQTDGAWTNPNGDGVGLRQSGATFTYTLNSGARWEFQNGQCVAQVDSDGQRTTTTYTTHADGSTTEVRSNAFGRALRLDFDAAGQLQQLTDPAGQTIRYQYSNGNLSAVLYPDATPDDDTDNPRKQYLYEDARFPQHLTGIIDENGQRYATYAYDAQGRGVRSEHAGAAGQVRLDYLTPDTTQVSETLDAERTYSKTYQHTRLNGAERITAIDYAACPDCTLGSGRETYTYDALGHLDRATDRRGLITDHDYNARGLEERRVEAWGTPEARTITTTWHPTLAQPVQVTEPGKTTDYVYTADGLLSARTVTDTASGEARTTRYTYYPNRLLQSVDGPRTDVADLTQYAYTAQGDLASVTNALGHVTQITAHDAHGHPLTVIDPNGVTTTLSYTPRGWLQSRRVAGQTTTYTYDPVGQLTGLALPNGVTLTYEYDAAHRLSAVLDAQGNRQAYTYDARGQLTRTQVQDAQGAVHFLQSQAHNALGQLAQSLGAAQQSTTYAYDASGNLETVHDPEQHTTGYRFDALNRLQSQVQPGNAETRFGYTEQDQLHSVSDAAGLHTTYTRNAFGEVLSETSPNTGTTTFSYDPAGNLATRTDARGVTVTYTYDALNRRTRADYPGTADDIQYSYDNATAGEYGLGRLAGVRNTYEASGSNLRYTYTALGQVAQELRYVWGGAYVTRYAYDGAGLLIRETYPSGREFAYPRDSRGRITQVNYRSGSTTATLARDLQYRPFGPLTQLTYENGLTLSRDYDLDYQLTGQRLGSQLDWRYGYGPGGQLQRVTDARAQGGNRTYAYDALDRLLSAAGDNGTFSYTSDATGNRTGAQQNGLGDAYVLQPASQRLDKLVRDGSDRITYAYDALGNVTQRGDLTLRYNAWGRLSRVERNGQLLASYTYNPLGQRTSKTVAGVQTAYHYDQYGRLLEETQAGAYRRVYAYLDALLISEIDLVAGQRVAVHTDHLGSPVRATDARQAVVWQAHYAPFGQATLTTAAVTLNVRLPGQYFDAETGFHYNYYRDYDPETGRYLQSDPIGLEGGINTYAYVSGNPTNSIDPNGLRGCQLIGTVWICDFSNPPLAPIPGLPDYPERQPNVEIPDVEIPGFVPDFIFGGIPGTLMNPQNWEDFINWCEGEDTSANAPGVPSATDGFVPKKNWDGRKVSAPNGRGYGYPDANGNVWVPTGPGSSAHGGPHWDVQGANGRSYDNIYPGGKRRGGRR